MKFLGIIPARYASTRFPGKPLALLGGKPVIQRVYERASQAMEVVVATDDSRIYDAVKAFGGNVVMTSTAHRSGTDRCREAYANYGVEADVVINIQGDEPFIAPSQIEALKACFDDPDVDIATLVRPFDPARGYDALEDPNTPKVVVADNGDALYFSRSVIPYVRGKERSEWPAVHGYFTHVGVYAFRTPVLCKIVELPRSPLELAESLEQLRWLQGGYRIRTAVTLAPSVGIDTPADLAEAERLIVPDRTVAPEAVDCAPVSLTEEIVEHLPNGICFHIVNGGDLQMLRLALFAQGGSVEAPSPAVRNVMMETIYEATADYDADTMADIIDFNGARLGSRTAEHFSGIELMVLNSRLRELMPVLRSIILHGAFDDKTVEINRRKLEAACATRMTKVEMRVSDRMRAHMAGEGHPAARFATPEQYEAVTVADCAADYAILSEGVSHAFLGGSLSPDDISSVREFLLSLPGKAPENPCLKPFEPLAPGREHIEMPDTRQWAVSMGLPAIPRSHPDYNALRLTVVALGGYFGSRLMKNIREEKGLTYGISASLLGMREGSYVEIAARCDGKYVDRLIEETVKEMKRLAQEPPEGDELRRLRLYVWSQLAGTADSPLSTLEYYISNLMIGAPEGYFDAQLREIAALTSERIAYIARKYLDPDKMTVITAGATAGA